MTSAQKRIVRAAISKIDGIHEATSREPGQAHALWAQEAVELGMLLSHLRQWVGRKNRMEVDCGNNDEE